MISGGFACLLLDVKLISSLDILGKIISPMDSLTAGVVRGIFESSGVHDVTQVLSTLRKTGWSSESQCCFHLTEVVGTHPHPAFPC